jgi:RNA recognition motif-containing protein
MPNLFLGKGIEMKIYVGNLAPQTSEETLQAAFAAFGEVSSVAIITDRFTSQSRGFGFIEMPDRAQAQAAIAGMNSKALDGNTLTVSEAKPREPRAGGGGGGYGGGRGGGGGGYGGGRGGGGYGGGRSGGGGTHTGRRRSY